MADTVYRDHGVVSTQEIKTRKWYAWNNFMPPKPDFFYVIGEVEVSNLGVNAILRPAEPPSITPELLILDLILVQEPGNWTTDITWTQARYENIILDTLYNTVVIRYEGRDIAKVPVEDIH